MRRRARQPASSAGSCCVPQVVKTFARPPNDSLPERSDPGGTANHRDLGDQMAKSNRTGIWHETFLVRAGEYEAIYANMPPRGLGRAGRLVALSGSSSARSRVGKATARA